MRLFYENACISICLKNKNKYVRLAVEDMRRDFERVSEYCVLPEIVEQEKDGCIVIEENTASACWDEGFTIKSEPGKVRISAKEYLGTMWAIYTFCEKFLGVDPCYLFNDLEITKHKALEIPDVDITEKPKGFHFRGAFINDEDLLTGWKDRGGIRYLDYSFYGMTVDESVMNMVVETVLRLKLNLVIPASFLDIDNAPEKLLADCVARRGIYLSQHHLEPLGLSSHTFKNYCKKYNKTGEFSYIKSPEAMVQAWEFYANKWAQYDNIVWQIGLRGENDRPVWQEDQPTDTELAAYGEYISRAYETQKQIVLKATGGKAKYFTSTLWMEGSALMEKGFLKFPEDTMIIFADAGPNQMYGKEYYAIPRSKQYKYGIYYHLQYYGCGPHLAPQTGLDKLYYNTRCAYKNGDDAYYIMNVSNIREFVFELKAYSQMVWDMDGFSKEKYQEDYCRQFQPREAEAKILITKYFSLLPCIDSKYLSKHLSKYFNYCMDETPEGIKNFVLKEGMILSYGNRIIAAFHKAPGDNLCPEFYEALQAVIPDYEALCHSFAELAGKVPLPLKKHIECKWLLFAKTLLCIYKWYVALYEAKQYCDMNESEKMKKSLNAACESLKEYLRFRKNAEYGIFENWYRGDLKMNVKQKLFDTYRLLGQTPDFS